MIDNQPTFVHSSSQAKAQILTLFSEFRSEFKQFRVDECDEIIQKVRDLYSQHESWDDAMLAEDAPVWMFSEDFRKVQESSKFFDDLDELFDTEKSIKHRESDYLLYGLQLGRSSKVVQIKTLDECRRILEEHPTKECIFHEPNPKKRVAHWYNIENNKRFRIQKVTDTIVQYQSETPAGDTETHSKAEEDLVDARLFSV